MKTTMQEYSWFNDLSFSVAGCVTVVPAADRAAVLAAFGALEDSRRPVGSIDGLVEGPERLPEHWVYVVEAGDALVVVEDNGFQGVRPEVLGPASTASGVWKAAAFFWNVESLTDFSAARRGKVVCSVELLGSEDEDLDDVPKALRPLVIEGGSEEGDMLGAGGALVAAYTGVKFTKDMLDGGTFYEIELPASPLLTYRRDDDFEYIYAMPDVVDTVGSLSAVQQRRFAAWTTVAAVREAGLQDEPSVQRALAQLGTGSIPALTPGLEALARRTSKATEEFHRLAEDLEIGGIQLPEHPYYEATAETMFGLRQEISQLEGLYLSQRHNAVEAVRYLTHDDPFSAAVGCLRHASSTYANGRTTRGALFEENETGRHLRDYEPNPRHLQFTNVITALLAAVITDAADSDDAWGRADAELPRPLSAEERNAAIVTDAQAALNGDFDTYQIESSAHDSDWGHDGWSVEGDTTHTVMLMDESGPTNFDAGFDEVPIEFLAEEVDNLTAVIAIATDPQRFITLLRDSASLESCITALREAFGLDERQAHRALYTPAIALTEFGLADVRSRHQQASEELLARRRALNNEE